MTYYEHKAIVYRSYPPRKWWERLLLWLRYGPDSICDCCGIFTGWNGNITKEGTTLCDNCHSRIM